jgi:hypothetical protein
MVILKPIKRIRVATDKQIAANRANAKRSTSPKTAAGRLKSSQNAFRHGLSCPPRLAPGMSTKFEAIAHALRAVGENTEAATECAEALLDLARIRSVRAQITAAMEIHEYGDVQELRRLAALDRYERLAKTKRRRASHKLRQG